MKVKKYILSIFTDFGQKFWQEYSSYGFALEHLNTIYKNIGKDKKIELKVASEHIVIRTKHVVAAMITVVEGENHADTC